MFIIFNGSEKTMHGELWSDKDLHWIAQVKGLIL